MKFKHILIILSCIVSAYSFGQNSLQGKIIDALTKQSIPGAIVYIPQLQLGTTTDTSGFYKMESLPKGTYSVEVRLLGYATSVRQVTLNGLTKANFQMNIAASAGKEVVITGLGNVTTAQRSPNDVTLVSHEMLLENTATNVVDAISLQPGINAVTTGPGVSKPEIRGLGFNRVLVTFDGFRQEDFQWGDEHGIQIDPYAVYNSEIIRGPASLQYGSDAVGGVVSFKSAPFPESGVIQGSVITEYQTNNGLIGTSEDVTGNNKGFVWDLRASDQEAHCYQDPKDGYVWGTAFEEANARLTLGLNRNWGFSRLTFSTLHRTIEIPDGNRDSATGQFKFDFPINGQTIPNNSNFLSYNPTSVGYQQIEHDMITWQSGFNAGKGMILADVGYSLDHREEIDSGSVPALNMYMYDIPYSIKYQVSGDTSGLKFTAGINGMYENMHNASEAVYPYSSVFLVPNYDLFDIGGFAILQKDYKNLTLNGGLRYDTRTEVGQSLYLLNPATPNQQIVPEGTPDAYRNFQGFNTNYNGFSASIGGSYQLPDNNYVKINLAKSYRAPAITEIGENGVHPGTGNFEIGDPSLKPESGYEADLTFGSNGRDIGFEIDGFYNDITNFIFASRLASANGGDSLTQGLPTFKFKANVAHLEGIEAFFNIHPADTKWIELDNGFTYIYSYLPHQTDSTQHVPWTPAPRLTSDVKFKLHDRHTSVLQDTYIKFGLAHYWAQNNIYSADWTEFPSVAYTLFNAGIGTSFVNPKTSRTICTLIINVTNLTDLAYIDHTSRLQYFLSYNGVTPVTVVQPGQGIYNMGRNIGFKLLFPFGGKKTEASAGSAQGDDEYKY
ncbi:MAG TPA: TonB-dependent receptor [Bacteroidia bacterium]|nr:TonB-dependent receptor [Bacteroidia bacterium]